MEKLIPLFAILAMSLAACAPTEGTSLPDTAPIPSDPAVTWCQAA